MVIAAVPKAPKAPKLKAVDATNYTESGNNTLTNDIDGNAATAAALLGDGGNCGAGNYPLGVDASGNAQSCTADADTQYDGDDFALSNQSCSVGQVVTGVDASGKVTCVSTSSGGGMISSFCSGTNGRIQYSAGWGRESDATAGLPMPGDGTFTSLGVNPFNNNLDGDTIVTLVVNGADTALAITIPAGSTAIQIVTSDVPVLAGDLVALKLDGRLSDPEPIPPAGSPGLLECIATFEYQRK